MNDTAKGISGSRFNFQSWLIRHRDALANAISTERPDVRQIKAQLLRSNDTAFVIKAALDDQTAVIKAFNPDIPQSRPSFTRELDVLMYFQESGLVPRILSFSRNHRFVAMEFIAGSPLLEVIDDQSLAAHAGKLGSWLGEFAALAPSKPLSMDWFAYLSNYDAIRLDASETHTAFLKNIPITTAKIAKSDAHLSNFIRTDDGRLIGIDFETSALKPVGWDILVTARALTRLFPGRAKEIIAALISGWSKTYKSDAHSPSAKDLGKLASFFVQKTAFDDLAQNRSKIQRYIETYNANRSPDLKEAAKGFIVPYQKTTLVTQNPMDVEALRAHILKLAGTPVERMAGDVSDSDTDEPNMSSGLVAGICATCRGKCCSLGVRNNAFLKAADLGNIKQTAPDVTDQEIVDIYISYLPDKHVSQSCFFHAENGCALPRDKRSSTCNSYLCAAAQLAEDNSKNMDASSATVLIVSQEDATPKRAALWDQNTLTQVKMPGVDDSES